MYWKHSEEENWSTDKSHEVPSDKVFVGSIYKCQKSDDDDVESGVLQIITGRFVYANSKTRNLSAKVKTIYRDAFRCSPRCITKTSHLDKKRK